MTNNVAPDGGAGAETEAAYREIVMGVSSSILDCAVVRPTPAIDLYILTASRDAGAALKVQALNALDVETVRTLGDEITVKACQAVASSPHLIICCYSGAVVIETMAQSEVAKITQD